MSSAFREVDVVVLGAGAAGMMCAIEAAKRGRRVVVLERNREIGEKIRISGGGRCNFTNTGAAPACYVSENPRFCTSALARFTPQDFIGLVEHHGIAWHEKKLGQLFCDGSSQAIITMLREEVAWAGGEIIAGVEVEEVSKGERFKVATSAGLFCSETLVVATGGLSIPKMGATDFGHRLAARFEVNLTPRLPALVPLTWDSTDKASFTSLAGVSADAAVRCNGVHFWEHLLFTHRGLSGPAILQISSYWTAGQAVEIDLLPQLNGGGGAWLAGRKREHGRLALASVLGEMLPKRLAQHFCERQGWTGTLADTRDVRLVEIAGRLHHWHVMPAGTEGFAKAEVTRGGVSTDALSPKTMEAKSVPGLFFIGEVVDVTGWLGGYNFQWAWSSGHAAGQVV